MTRALVTGALLLSLALTVEPAAACNAGKVALVAHRGAPWLIGDSTAILAAPALARHGVSADAHGCRQFDQGVAMVARRGRSAPDAIVLALGANGQVTRAQIARARRVLGSHRFLVLVTPRNSAATRAAMLAAQRAHPDRVLTLDWTAFSEGHAGWFAGDGLHVGLPGARAYARFVARGLRPFLRPGPRVARPAACRPCGRVRAAGRTTRVFVARGDLACPLARARMAAPRLHPLPRWRFYDRRAAPGSPWTDVLARRDGSIVIAGITA